MRKCALLGAIRAAAAAAELAAGTREAERWEGLQHKRVKKHISLTRSETKKKLKSEQTDRANTERRTRSPSCVNLTVLECVRVRFNASSEFRQLLPAAINGWIQKIPHFSVAIGPRCSADGIAATDCKFSFATEPSPLGSCTVAVFAFLMNIQGGIIGTGKIPVNDGNRSHKHRPETEVSQSHRESCPSTKPSSAGAPPSPSNSSPMKLRLVNAACGRLAAGVVRPSGDAATSGAVACAPAACLAVPRRLARQRAKLRRVHCHRRCASRSRLGR